MLKTGSQLISPLLYLDAKFQRLMGVTVLWLFDQLPSAFNVGLSYNLYKKHGERILLEDKYYHYFVVNEIFLSLLSSYYCEFFLQVGKHGIIIEFTDPDYNTRRSATYLPEIAAHEGNFFHFV